MSFPRIASWFNLRSLTLCVGLVLIVGPLPPQWSTPVDGWLLNLGASLVPPADRSQTLALVDLPSRETTALVQGVGGALETHQLIQQLTADPKTPVLMLLPQAPWQPISTAGVNETEATTLPASFRDRVADWRRFSDQVVVIGSPSHTAPVIETALVADSYLGLDYSRYLPPWRRAQPPSLPTPTATNPTTTAEPASTTSSLSSWALANTQTDLSYPLVFTHQQQYLPGWVIAAHSRQAKASPSWDSHTLALGSLRFATGVDGRIIPLLGHTKHPLRYRDYSLAQALQHTPSEEWVVINGLGDDQWRSHLHAFFSLEQGNYLHTPGWFYPLELLLLGAVLLYLVLLLPRLPWSAGILATCLLGLLVVIANLGWLLTQRQWLPMGWVLQYLLLGYGLMSLWRHQRQHYQQLLAAAHGARYQLGLQLFRDGRSDDALLAIKECHTSDAVLNLMYDIAAQQERKRQYAEAVKTYQGIVARRPQFKDAPQKVEKLMAFSSGGAASLSGDSDITQTLIISETTINKPVLGRYEIERELGRGAMGVVYLGRDPKIARQVAIKTLSYGQIQSKQLSEFKARFFREAEAAGRLNHPNIVTIYDVGEEHDLAFIAMDYVKGEPLSSYIEDATLLPTRGVLEIVAQVADALAYAHQHQVIHRDVKPGNILYQDKSATVKVTDFGVARIVDSAKTSTGDILGSPLYMSPEQLQGQRVTETTDIYSLGVTSYQLLTGQLPFNGDNLANLTYNIIHEKHKGVREWRPDLPKGITRVINKALHKQPDKRFQSAEEFATAIRKLLEEMG